MSLTRLAVIVPVYNEADTIASVLSRLLEVPLTVEIIIVDDASTDSTYNVARQWVDGHRRAVEDQGGRLELLRHATNRGKGSAIRTALQVVLSSFVVIQDGDREYDPLDLPRLLEPLIGGRADVTYGSRYLRCGSDVRGQPRWCRYGVSLLNAVVLRLYGVQLTDEATCYKLLRTSVLREMALECQRFEFCPEVTAKACRLGLRIVEVPISYTPRSNHDGKKIRLSDGIEALVTLWRFRNWQPAPSIKRELESGSGG